MAATFAPIAPAQLCVSLPPAEFQDGSFADLGDSFAGGTNASIYSFQPTWTLIRGSHSFRSGGDFRAYRVLRHQHTPEIERALALAGQPPLKVTFTPHLLPTRRGILATVYGRLNPGKTAADAAAAIDRFVAGKPFLRAAKPDAVRLHPIVGTNRVLLGADADPERGVAIAFAALDNLVKGAAGQAVQNVNLMLGLEETTGLMNLPGSAP